MNLNILSTKRAFKGERKKLLKTDNLLLSDNAWSGKREFYLFYYNAILKDLVSFKVFM